MGDRQRGSSPRTKSRSTPAVKDRGMSRDQQWLPGSKRGIRACGVLKVQARKCFEEEGAQPSGKPAVSIGLASCPGAATHQRLIPCAWPHSAGLTCTGCWRLIPKVIPPPQGRVDAGVRRPGILAVVRDTPKGPTPPASKLLVESPESWTPAAVRRPPPSW